MQSAMVDLRRFYGKSGLGMALFWIYALGALERARTKGFRKCTFRHSSALGLIPENDDAMVFLSSSSSSLVNETCTFVRTLSKSI